MSLRPLRAYRAGISSFDEPKYYVRLPDDLLEDVRLSRTTKCIAGNLLKGIRDLAKPLRVTQREIASRAAVSIRTVKTSIASLSEAGWIRTERDYSIRGAPFVIIFCFELRPVLKLEADAFASGTRSAPKGQRAAPCKGQRAAPCKGQRAAPSLFEFLEREEKIAAESPRALEVPATTPPRQRNPDAVGPIYSAGPPRRGALPALPSPLPSEEPPSVEDVAGTIAGANDPRSPAMARAGFAGLLRGWVRLGFLDPSVLDQIASDPAARKKPAAGHSAKVPPRPVGDPSPLASSSYREQVFTARNEEDQGSGPLPPVGLEPTTR